MEIIKINTLDGETWEGFKISHQRELPVNSILHKCAYNEQFENYNIYLKFSKRGTKTYILKSKEIQY